MSVELEVQVGDLLVCARMSDSQFSRQWVEENSSAEKMLLIIKDKVYDVTAFAEEHPGGSDILFDVVGRYARGADTRLALTPPSQRCDQ